MKVLAMDTATAQGRVLLLDQERTVAEGSLPLLTGQVATLPVMVAGLLAQAGWTWREVGLVVVTLGPVSFTGVRIALGMAKGLALAHQTPLVGVPTLQVLAADGEGEILLPLMDARRGEVFAALYRREGEGLVLWGEVQCLPPDQVADCFAPLVGERTVRVLGDVHLLPETGLPIHWQRQPTVLHPLTLAREGRHQFEQYGGADALLEPLYVRPSEAESKRLA